MDEQQTFQILDLMHTIQEACLELHSSAGDGRTDQFQRLCGDMEAGLECIWQQINAAESIGNEKLRPACQSVSDTLARVRGYYQTNRARCLQKIEFELLPLLQQAYLTYYFFQYLVQHPEHLPEYYAEEKNLLCGNSYIDEAIERGRYKYEVSIAVIGYNKLDYTKRCVESLLANIPRGLNYELILVNHGSSDGTKEYFERIQPHKQLDIAVNGGGSGALYRIVEGEFTLTISNDVIVMPYAIENLLACIRSDDKIAWVVPTTPNVSNFQTIPAQYESYEKLMAFARKNNRQNPFLWEQRVRLCNPIDIYRSDLFCATSGFGIAGWFHTTHPTYANSFPDDRISLLLRRNGYKMMLAKDAYCHHFGSVTLRDEISQVSRQNEQNYYLEGRREFYRAFHVDPWGTGFCYDRAFMERVVGNNSGHTEILGINCGLGSNSLKLKEQIKEYCHNRDAYLTNITGDANLLEDLKGISDAAEKVCDAQELEQFLKGRSFDYILWEDSDRPGEEEAVLQLLMGALAPQGRIFIRKKEALRPLLTPESGWREVEGNWYTLLKEREETVNEM